MDTPKEKKDEDKVQPNAAIKNKRKSENSGRKRVGAGRGVLLSGSLNEVIEVLRESRLQQAKKVRKEKRQRKVDMKKQHIEKR